MTEKSGTKKLEYLNLGASARLALLLLFTALLPVAVFGACLLAGLPATSAVAGALFGGASAALLAFRWARSGLTRPVCALSSAVKEYIAASYHLAGVVPKQGWPEAAGLISLLNRLMLELSAYRGFNLDQALEERAKAQALIETITDGVLLVDNRGQLISSNRLALNLLGINKPAASVVLPADVRQAAFLPLIERLLNAPDEYCKSEVEVPSKDESYTALKSFRGISRRFDLATLKKPGRVIVIRDVTAEKEIESARETFFHMITHDMRAPLASIQGYAELMGMNTPHSPKSDKYLQAIMRSSLRLNGMIEDILNTIKMERGEMTLKAADVDAGEMCARIVEVHEPLAARKNISLLSVAPPEKIILRGDPVLLERVMTNLVGNSLKFTPPGGKVAISCRAEEKNARFCVADTGPGVPEEKRGEIFDKYAQLEEHKYMGFGLGLAMCKMAVELHGGRIWVESGAGEGSEFIFVVPRG